MAKKIKKATESKPKTKKSEPFDPKKQLERLQQEFQQGQQRLAESQAQTNAIITRLEQIRGKIEGYQEVIANDTNS